MSQIYLEYTFTITPLEPGKDILIAELGVVGFESFVETEEGAVAYLQKDDWYENIFTDVKILENPIFTIDYTYKEIEQTNWNAEWEKNFHPIQVNNQCTVRAPFHEKPTTEFDIIIEPKMSFGTGHHETTHMMIQHLLKIDLKEKSVLDMGCGTGVLAILTALKGATSIDAIDIDTWCYTNSLENVERNKCNQINVIEGDASLLENKKYDVIIANINRNILLKDIPVYASCLHEKGILLLSGFYEDDIQMIHEVCIEYALKFVEKIEKNFWVAVKYIN